MKTLFTLAALLLLSPLSRAADLQPVASVDPARYLGDWYQIAHVPQLFEGLLPCACARQRLTPGPTSSSVVVFNSCNSGDATGALHTITGVATAEDASFAKYSVDFHLPWKGSYWVIALDPDYRYAVVSDEHKLSLYVLSKTPTLPKDLYDAAVAQAAKQLDVKKLQITNQTYCKYPQ